MKQYSLRKIESQDIKYFTINLGLLPGYKNDKEHTLEELLFLVKNFISEKLDNNETPFPFKITPLHFAYGFNNNEEKIVNSESAVEVQGEILREYFESIFDNDEALLGKINELASFLGQHLQQERIHIQFSGQKYILE